MNCVGCVYERFRKIPATPIRHADIAVVGEAPGNSELAQGVPFVGESGRVLQRALEIVKMPPKETMFITNALLCRPPKGAIKRSAIDRCRSRVIAELQAVHPKMILSLGSPALQCISNNANLKITQYHGVPFDCSFLPGTTVIPIFHPASLFRNPGNYQAFIAGFRYAASLWNGEPPKDPGKTEWEYVDTYEEAQKAIEMLKTLDIIFLDSETAGFDFMRNRIIDAGIGYAKNKVIIFPEHAIQWLKPLLDSAKPLQCWQYGQFDTPFWRWRGIKARIDHDTLLLQYCLNENEGDHDLDTMSRRILGAAEYKSSVKPYIKKGDEGYESVPKHILWPYLAKDCDYLGQIFYILLAQVESDPELKHLYYDHLLPSSRFLRRVQRNGLYLNIEYVNILRVELQHQLDKVVDKIVDQLQEHWDPEAYIKSTGAKKVGLMFMPTSNQQLAWMLFTRLGMKHTAKRKKPGCVDKDVLKTMVHLHPAITDLIEMRRVNKMLSTYVIGMLKRRAKDGRVHCNFLLHGTVTGRLSSRKPNLQNIPRDSKIKNIFCAAPGNVLIEFDYKGAELRVLAYLSQDDFLRNVFLTGRDLHDEVATFLFGAAFTKEQRVKAKNVNFGIAYGRTHYTIAEEFKMSEIEAKALLDEWFRRAPKAHKYLLECDGKAERGEVLVTPFGRKRRFGLISNVKVQELRNEARNFPIQSIASDLNLSAGRNMENEMSALKGMIVNLVHDNTIVEVKDDPSIIKEAILAGTKHMVNAPKIYLNTDVPFEVEVKVGKVWGELKGVE